MGFSAGKKQSRNRDSFCPTTSNEVILRNRKSKMGMVFGKTGVEEPAFEVLLKHSKGFPYEVRKYGERFAAETAMSSENSAFQALARYIGVFGNPENEGQESMAMTAPVVKETKAAAKIAMTAPVVKSEEEGLMQFMLPKEYDSLSKIPKPTNPNVHIKVIPPAVGAVHRFSGSMLDEISRSKASQLGLQLRQDGLEDLTEDFVLENFLFFGYNPPFTLPPLRRNEVWVPLTAEQTERLLNGFSASDAN